MATSLNLLHMGMFSLVIVYAYNAKYFCTYCEKEEFPY